MAYSTRCYILCEREDETNLDVPAIANNRGHLNSQTYFNPEPCLKWNTEEKAIIVELYTYFELSA